MPWLRLTSRCKLPVAPSARCIFPRFFLKTGDFCLEIAKTMMLCPGCNKATERKGNQFRPFCSERCKLTDLGHWASGSYRVSMVHDENEEEASDVSEGSSGRSDPL